MQVFGLAPATDEPPFDCLNLDFETRSKSRFKSRLMTTGAEVGVLVARGGGLRGGSLLVDTLGRLVEVVAADEELLRVEDRAFALMRCAYHLGNRHVRIEITEGYLQFRADPVLAEMLRQLGVHPVTVVSAFEPEWGAYGGGHQHGHDTTFPEDYALAQAVFASRGPG
jgi:urease accessory protein